MLLELNIKNSNGFEISSLSKFDDKEIKDVTKDFEMEAIFCFAKGCVGGFKGEQATPGDVVGRVNHAKHVQNGQHQAPKANTHHDGRINGHLSGGGLGGCIVAHGPCDLRTAFKHTETGELRTKPHPHNEVWWW